MDVRPYGAVDPGLPMLDSPPKTDTDLLLGGQRSFVTVYVLLLSMATKETGGGMYIIRKLLGQLGQYKLAAILAPIFTLAAVGLEVLIPYVMALLIEAFQ